jgi:hypothetical protein
VVMMNCCCYGGVVAETPFCINYLFSDKYIEFIVVTVTSFNSIVVTASSSLYNNIAVLITLPPSLIFHLKFCLIIVHLPSYQ